MAENLSGQGGRQGGQGQDQNSSNQGMGKEGGRSQQQGAGGQNPGGSQQDGERSNMGNQGGQQGQQGQPGRDTIQGGDMGRGGSAMDDDDADVNLTDDDTDASEDLDQNSGRSGGSL